MKYTRTPYLVVSEEKRARMDVYGSIDDSVVRQAQLLRGPEDSKTAVVAMHPVGSPGYLPAFSHLARRGLHVVACGTRYTTGDAGLQMENALLDLAACVRDAKDRLGYEKIILVGWSGGGSLIAGYQAEAEKKTIFNTASGEASVIETTEFDKADGVVLMASHRSRHHLITDFLDPSIIDELDPSKRDVELDIYSSDNPNKPPYTAEYVQKYRAAQRARNAKITDFARSQYRAMQEAGRTDDEHCFVVHGTMADLRWVDPSIDPNDRRPNWSYLGDPRVANTSPSSLARFTTTRGWLSQWSLEYAQVDAVDSAPRITVPAIVIANSADDACPPVHQSLVYNALGSSSKRFHEIKGANHYFSGGEGQRPHLDEAADQLIDWANEEHLLGD